MWVCAYIYICMYIYMYIYLPKNRKICGRAHVKKNVNVRFINAKRVQQQEPLVQCCRRFLHSKSARAYIRRTKLYSLISIKIDSLPANAKM